MFPEAIFLILKSIKNDITTSCFLRSKKHFWQPLSHILVVPRSSRGRPKAVWRRHFGALARQFWGGCLSRFAAFRFLCSWFNMLMIKIDNPYRRLGCCACYMFFLVRLVAAPAQHFAFFGLCVFVACCFLMTPIADPLLLFLNMSPRNRFWLRRRSVLWSSIIRTFGLKKARFQKRATVVRKSFWGCKNVELSNENFVKSLFYSSFRNVMLQKRTTVERKLCWCCKNVELSNENFVKSLFCFVFRNVMLQKRRTVERKSCWCCKNVELSNI